MAILKTTLSSFAAVTLSLLAGCFDNRAARQGGVLGPPRAAIASTQFSSEAESLCCSLLVEHSASGADSPNRIRVILTNTGFQEFSFIPYHDVPAHVILRFPNGNDAPLTEYGRSLFEPSSYYSVSVLPIPDGLSLVWEFDLDKIFRLPVAGTYNLIISQPVDYWTGTQAMTSDVRVSGLIEIEKPN
jgi:hypothetical protein